MDTELYNILQTKLYESGMTRRNFARLHGLSHAWFIDFINPKIKFRPLQTKTIKKLHDEFDISFEILRDYNEKIYKERGIENV